LNITDVKCHECCCRFNNIRQFHRHTRAQNCLHCRTALNCDSDFQLHVLPTKCDVCGEVFRCKGKSDAHERQLVACQHCYEKLHSPDGQILHKELNQCTDCRRQFPCLTLLNKHSCARFVTPPAESATPPPWQCQHCKNFYDGIYSQESHVRRNQCLCGAMFQCQHLLQCHAYTHGCSAVIKKPEKREKQSISESYAAFTCRTCNVTFGTFASLAQHNHLKPDCLLVKKVRPTCLHCPLVFATVALKEKHAELKECVLCKYQFGCPLALELHHCEKSNSADTSNGNLESKKRPSVDSSDVAKIEVADEVSSEPCETKHHIEKKRKLTLVELMLSKMKSEMCSNADDVDAEEEQDECASDLIGDECLSDMLKVELHEEEGEVPLEEYPVQYPVLVADVVHKVHLNIDELSPQ
jgi:hypothetical protein